MNLVNILVAIVAAIISSSILVVGLDPILYERRRRRLYHGWQAVQLDDGSIYFGVISKLTREELFISDIYYLRDTVHQRPVKTDGLGYNDDIMTHATELIKLGEEIHGPEDEMIITKSHVIFTENLKPTAKVIEAIEDHRRAERVQDVPL